MASKEDEYDYLFKGKFILFFIGVYNIRCIHRMGALDI